MYLIEQDLLQSCSEELLTQDIHILALKYHWDYNTCMSLTFNVRRKFVKKIVDMLQAQQDELEKQKNSMDKMSKSAIHKKPSIRRK